MEKNSMVDSRINLVVPSGFNIESACQIYMYGPTMLVFPCINDRVRTVGCETV